MSLISIWAVIRWMHLLAAMTWIGGMIFILIVLLPVMRRSLSPLERTLLFAKVGQRYFTASWIAVIILVITGILNAERRGVDWTRLTGSQYGRTLHLKLEIAGVVVVLTLIHALYFGKKLARLAERVRDLGEDEETARERRRLQIVSGSISAVNLVLNFFVVLLAASLVA